MLQRYLLILGLVVVTCLIGYKLSYFMALDFFAILLVLIAGVYIGFAIEDGRISRIVVETGAAVCFAALALLGMWKWPLLIPAGYFAHGIWDLLHHPLQLGARVKSWYPPACVVYDWLVGAFIYFYLF